MGYLWPAITLVWRVGASYCRYGSYGLPAYVAGVGRHQPRTSRVSLAAQTEPPAPLPHRERGHRIAQFSHRLRQDDKPGATAWAAVALSHSIRHQGMP
jgi:hypothetical protein